MNRGRSRPKNSRNVGARFQEALIFVGFRRCVWHLLSRRVVSEAF